MPSLPLPVIPGVFYGYLYMTFAGRRVGSTFSWLANDTAMTAPNAAIAAQQIADAMVSSWNTNMMPRYPSGVSGTNARVYPLAYPSLPAALSFAGHSGAGGSSIAPAASAAVIRHSVARRGRGSQGHTQISPLSISETDLSGDSVTDAFVTNVTSDFGDFIGGVQAAYTTASGGGTVDYVLLSKKHGLVSPITSSQVEKLLGTERSRTARP